MKLQAGVAALGIMFGVAAGFSSPAIAAKAEKPAAKTPSSANREVRYAPAAGWVRAAPAADPAAPGGGSQLRVIYSDQQLRVDPAGGADFYTGFRAKILGPQGLTIGNLSLDWNPDAGGVTVHRLAIIRDGAVIDVLQSGKFTIIQRESGLEQAQITGNLTAALQVPGLRVGDELEFASTVHAADPTFPKQTWGLGFIAPGSAPGAYRLDLSWPATQAVRWKASDDLGAVEPVTVGDRRLLSIALQSPKPFKEPTGAPLRYKWNRTIQYSTMSEWSTLSSAFHSLLTAAGQWEPSSPLHAEVARIAAQTSDPEQRALAALKLVQSEVRYVYVGLNGGNFRPMHADDTWELRFGDCKAKTVLLLSLLAALGIEAEPVLVAFGEDPGVAEMLPSPLAFNHLVVRAKIDGRSYWLDGTRLGDTSLARDEPPGFRVALPVRAGGAAIEAVPGVPPAKPLKTELVTLDMTGKDKVGIVVEHRLRGDSSFRWRSLLGSLTEDAARDAIKTYWSADSGWFTTDTVGWSFDEASAVLRLTAQGIDTSRKPIQPGEVHIVIPGAGFNPPGELKRPPDESQEAPWSMNFPEFSCYLTNVLLPPPGSGSRWNFISDPVDRKIGGKSYFRRAELRDGIMRTVMVSRRDREEISPQEAAELNEAIPKFNKAMSRIYRQQTVRNFKYPPTEAPVPLPLLAEANAAVAEDVCSIPPAN